MIAEKKMEVAPPTKAPRDRSPSYPFISLKAAVDRLAALDTYFGRHPAAANKAGLAWKMKPDSSQAAQTLASLKSFGLIDYQGSNDARVAVISEDGRNYLRAQQDWIKAEILKRCALTPKAIKTYWQLWGADRPQDPICLDELVIKGKFTESAAPVFLRVYDDTVAFAALVNGDTIPETPDETLQATPTEGQKMQSASHRTPPPPRVQPPLPLPPAHTPPSMSAVKAQYVATLIKLFEAKSASGELDEKLMERIERLIEEGASAPDSQGPKLS